LLCLFCVFVLCRTVHVFWFVRLHVLVAFVGHRIYVHVK